MSSQDTEKLLDQRIRRHSHADYFSFFGGSTKNKSEAEVRSTSAVSKTFGDDYTRGKGVSSDRGIDTAEAVGRVAQENRNVELRGPRRTKKGTVRTNDARLSPWQRSFGHDNKKKESPMYP